MPDDPNKKPDTPGKPDEREVFPVNPLMDRLFDENENLLPPVLEDVKDKSDPGPGGADDTKDDDPDDDSDDKDIDLNLDDLDDSGSGNDDGLDLESDPADETMARKQAKERGREAKRLQMELEEARLKLRETEQREQELRTRMSEVESSVVDPKNHPDVRNLLTEMKTDVSNSAELLEINDPNDLVSNFGTIMSAYIGIEGLEGKERAEKLVELKGLIVDSVIKPDIPYAELTPEERTPFASVVSEVLRVVQRNRKTISRLADLEKTIADQAKKGILNRSTRAYEAARSELQPIVDAVGALTDDLIEADPFSPSSIVSRLAKQPANKTRIERAKQEVLEVLVGPQSLTPEQVKTLEDNGTDVKAFIAERDRKIADRRKKLAPILVEAILTRGITKDALKAFLDKSDKSKASDNELAALRQVGKKAGSQPPPKKEKAPLMDRLFDDSEELR